MARSIELRNEWARELTAARAINDRADTENRDLTAEERAQWDAHMASMRSLEERVQRQEYLEENPVEGDDERFVRDRKDDGDNPPKSEAEDIAQKARAYREAGHAYMRRGITGVSQEERALLQSPLVYRTSPFTGQMESVELRQQEVQDLASGGFWVPDEMMQRVEKALLFFGGMRAVGSQEITTDSGADLPWPVYDDTANTGRRLAESAAVTQTDIAVGIRTMKAYMYSSDRILISYQLLQDAPLFAENLIADALGERIGRITNTEFTTYAGGDGPQGLIRATTVGVTAAATGAVTSDELEDLIFSVPVAYRNERMRYMGHDNTYRDILKLKDGEGRYLFRPDPRESVMNVRIHGVPFVVNNAMPTMATTVVAITCGDHSHYKIRNVRGFTLLRLNELYAANLQVGFFGFSRHDGQYINAGQNPIRHLAMA